VNRSLGAPWNIFADQNDSLAQRDTGWIQYYCESNQDVLDTVIQAFRVAERVLMPAMVCLDAFFLSHTSEPVAVPEQADVDEWLPPFAPPFTLTPDDPRAFGGLPLGDSYMELRARMQRAMDDALLVADDAARSYAQRFGRYHALVERSGAADADVVLVTTGSITGTAREVVARRLEAGHRVGLAKVRLFRPFPFAAICEAVKGAARVAVIDRNISFGHGGIVASEIRSALCSMPAAPVVFSFVAGLGGRDVTPEVIDDVLTYTLERPSPEAGTMWVGLKVAE
jgi:pyruvate/2-oxoacid:ferredoxin oxidoreductase alpha subunit